MRTAAPAEVRVWRDRDCLRHGPPLADRLFAIEGSVVHAEPGVTGEPKLWSRSAAALSRAPERSFLARLVARLPLGGAGNPAFLPYFGLLDRALEDRLMSPEECVALEACARQWGMSRATVERAHDAYFGSVASAAAADGRLSDSERRDLERVSAMLGLPDRRAADLLEVAFRSASSAPPPKAVVDGANDMRGLSECFTGELFARVNGEPVTRARAEELATRHGLVVKKAVSKKLDLLVVADPATLSGKASLARKYGTRVLAEAVFWSSLGVAVD